MGLKEEILSRIDFVSYYEKYVTFDNKQGKNWSALCPFHSEKKPSFYVEIKTGRWICKGSCNVGGDVFRFHERMNNCSFKDTLKYFADITGIDIKNEVNKYKKKEESDGELDPDEIDDDELGVDLESTIEEIEKASSEIKDKKEEQKQKKGRVGKYPPLENEIIEKLNKNLSEEEREYLHKRGITDKVIDEIQIGTWAKSGKRSFVFPVKRNGKLYNLRFYKPATDITEKEISQLPKNIVGHKQLWVFPEPREEEEIYLFEGEIDAMCALSLGMNATTFTGGAGDFLEDTLLYFKHKKVWICYDVDKAGRLGAKSIAGKIAKVAKETRIINLDLDREKYPKGDFNDYFIKEKKTLKDFEKLKKKATYEIYSGKDLSIFEDEGSYHKIEKKKGESVVTKISNFTIRLICRYIKDESMVREVILVHENEKIESDPRIISSEFMSNSRKFREFCFSCGDFIFEGSTDDLMDIWHLVCAQDPDSKIVRQVYQVGYLSKYDIWLFENVAIKNGKVIMPDERGIYWNGKAGYSLIPIDSSEEMLRHVPNLIITDNNKFGLMKELCDTMTKNIGTYDVLLGLGLVCGSVYFSNIIMNHEIGCFPILFVYGNHRSGKTEYVRLLMRMFGMGKTDSESLPSITSTVPISRRLAYYANMPVWWDEYRNDNPRTQAILGTLRSAYDGVGRSIGAKASHGVHYETIKSTVLISGEHLPTDEAFKSRLLPVHIIKGRRNIDYYEKVLKLTSEAPAHMFNLIKNKNKDSVDGIVGKIISIKKNLNKTRPELDERTVKNYSIALGCYQLLVNPDDKIIPDYLMNGDGVSPLEKDCIDEDDPDMTQLLQDFAESVEIEIETGNVSSDLSWCNFDNENNLVYVWLAPLYNQYALRHRQKTGDMPPSIQTILSQFKSSNFCIETSKQRRITEKDGSVKNKRCIVFDLDKLPKIFKNWFKD